MTSTKGKNKQWTAIFGLTVILTMTVFFLLYQVNNEYTPEKEQPVQGILYLDNENAYKKLHYLSRQWQYFPGRILTPEMLQNSSRYYSRYIYIGQYRQMEPDKKKNLSYSCGTYRMLVMLPEKEQTWALSMMEVPSAYRIYINGKLEGKVGDPVRKDYEGRVMNRVFTFQGSGATDIVINVGDKNHIRSGLCYIPVLGSPVNINLQRGIRVFISVFVLTFCLCIWIVTCFVHVSTHTREFGIFMLVFFCVLVYSVYPLIRSFFLLPVWPWHILRDISYYLILSCMIWLENCIMENKRGECLPILLNIWIAAFFMLETAGEFWSMPQVLFVVENINVAVRWCAALYMLVNTFGETEYSYGKIVLAGSTVYACSLTADRIWPLYEPVIGGWFPEIGGLVLALSLGCVLWQDLAEAYKVRLTYEVYSNQTELRLLAQKEHYEKLKAQMRETSRVRHDMRQHLRVLAALLERQQYEKMKEYLSRYTGEFQEKLTYSSYCKNQAADAILHYYEEACRSREILFQCQVEAPEETGIRDTDFCRLFGNLLENAIEAALLCPEKERRFIRVNIRSDDHKLLIKVENSCTGTLRKTRQGIFSGKRSGMGIGTASVSEIAARYGGLADFQEKDGVFRAEIFLSLRKKDTVDRPSV